MQFHTLCPTQNCRHFADNIFKSILLNGNAWISLTTSLKCVPKLRISNIPALVQIRAWRWQARSHYVNQWWLVYWRIYASLGLNEHKFEFMKLYFFVFDFRSEWYVITKHIRILRNLKTPILHSHQLLQLSNTVMRYTLKPFVLFCFFIS